MYRNMPTLAKYILQGSVDCQGREEGSDATGRIIKGVRIRGLKSKKKKTKGRTRIRGRIHEEGIIEINTMNDV